MGHEDPNAGNPTFVAVFMPGGPTLRYLLSAGWEAPPVGGSWHTACTSGEGVTAEEWATITAAAGQGWAALKAAIDATPAETWLARTISAAVSCGGLAAVKAKLVARYTAMHGRPLSEIAFPE